MIEFGVVYLPQCAWRECGNAEEARDTFAHAPQPEDQVAVLIIDWIEAARRGPDEVEWIEVKRR